MDARVFEGLAFWGRVVGQVGDDIFEGVDPQQADSARLVAAWLRGHAIAESEGYRGVTADLAHGETRRHALVGLRVRVYETISDETRLMLGEPHWTEGDVAWWLVQQPNSLGVTLFMRDPDGVYLRAHLDGEEIIRALLQPPA